MKIDYDKYNILINYRMSNRNKILFTLTRFYLEMNDNIIKIIFENKEFLNYHLNKLLDEVDLYLMIDDQKNYEMISIMNKNIINILNYNKKYTKYNIEGIFEPLKVLLEVRLSLYTDFSKDNNELRLIKKYSDTILRGKVYIELDLFT